MVSLRLKVVDDRTADGDADGLEFFDRFDLKFDPEVAESLGIGPEENDKDDKGKKVSLTQFLKNANKRDFTKKQQEALLDGENWVAMEDTKIAKLLGASMAPTGPWTSMTSKAGVHRQGSASDRQEAGFLPGVELVHQPDLSSQEEGKEGRARRNLLSPGWR